MVMGSLRQETEVAIIGAGPGGYVAALRAADLGKEVLLIEERERPGGVCLLEGCIPSKSLIHAVELVQTAREAHRMGLTFKDLEVDPAALRRWTDGVVDTLTRGISGLLERRGVEVVRGRARFESDRSLALEGSEVSGIDFGSCIIATGSVINEIPPASPGDGASATARRGLPLLPHPAPRPLAAPAATPGPVWSSADALRLPEVPGRLLVVGGGYIGLELGLVYAGLGSRVTIVEFFPRLLSGADPDLVQVVLRHCEARFEAVQLESKVVGMERSGDELVVSVEHGGEIRKAVYDRVLVAVGRRPNTSDLGLERAGIKLTEGGTVEVTAEQRSSVPHIYAIGDAAPGPMLAHKASREAKVAAEVIAGHPAEFDNRSIPAVVFTDPEIAWAGLTEVEAKQQGVAVRVGRFPLSALGRARTLGRPEGLVKVLSDPGSGLVLGVGMVGPMVSELIAEASLALEMGATLEDLMVTIHPHPTMSESLMEAAEVAAGFPVHINPPRKKG
jgi:dihydrolipoamide dehydrogenase